MYDFVKQSDYFLEVKLIVFIPLCNVTWPLAIWNKTFNCRQSSSVLASGWSEKKTLFSVLHGTAFESVAH